MESLGDIIVGSDLQPDNPIEDARISPASVRAVLAGHDDIKQNHLDSIRQLRTQRRTVRRHADPVTFLVEVAAEHLTDSLVVIHDQDMRRVIP
jgi:hypothetical protein